MILDALALFADAQTGTTSAASTDVINTVGKGDVFQNAWLAVRVDTAYTAVSGTPTNTFQLQTADNEDFISGAPVTLAQSAALTAAELLAGEYVWRVQLPVGLKKYIRVYKSAATASAGNVFWSAGAYDAFIVSDVDAQKVLA